MRQITSPVAKIFFVLYMIIMASCTPEACFEETDAFLKATFYDNETKKAEPPDSISLYGLNTEGIRIYSKSENIQPALFPVNASDEECTFVIRINGIDDTISFRYSSYPHLISKECGYTFFHLLDIDYYSSTGNIIDTIVFRNRNVTTANEENIRIYY